MPRQSFDAQLPSPALPPSSPPRVRLRRIALIGSTLAITATGWAEVWRTASPEGLTVFEGLLLLAFGPLFAWIAFAFVTAAAGFAALCRGRTGGGLHPPTPDPKLRTAILVPIYNEDTAAVFAGISAMERALARSGEAAPFDIMVLSDTTDRQIAAEERLAFLDLARRATLAVHYRRRERNFERKAGNVADWLRTSGGAYDLMLVLDADSLMSASAIRHLVGLMDANRGVGLLQSMPTVMGGETLFARWQQFAARLYGSVASAGLIWWSGAEASFWGHNAIIRVRAFAESCGLPHLPGREPFGGHILSHDLVEAALLRRRGWAVHMVPLADGSYEGHPPTLPDLAARDRRWCQGNLQHLRLLGTRGFHWVSRLQLFLGGASYLTSPLWLLFLVAALLEALFAPGATPAPAMLDAMSGWLLLLTAGLLLGPKLLGLAWTGLSRERRRGFGGAPRMLAGVLGDVPLAVLMAPIVMVSQTGAVAQLCLGRSGGWRPQRRQLVSMRLSEALRFSRSQLGVAGLLAAPAAADPALLLWVAPVVASLALTPAFVLLSARVGLGRAARRHGLFLMPEERAPPGIAEQARRIRARTPAPGTASSPALAGAGGQPA